MGYLVSSLGQVPVDDDITLYIFVVNGTWRGGASGVLEDNFVRIAERIGPTAAIVKGLKDDLVSEEAARKYLGKDYTDLLDSLPGLLLTDAHPEDLQEDSLRLLVPLKDAEARFGSFDAFFHALAEFAQNRDMAFLEKFEDKEDLLEAGNAIIDLKPNMFGVGVNLNALFARLKERGAQ